MSIDLQSTRRRADIQKRCVRLALSARSRTRSHVGALWGGEVHVTCRSLSEATPRWEPEAPQKIQEVTLMRPFHGNL